MSEAAPIDLRRLGRVLVQHLGPQARRVLLFGVCLLATVALELAAPQLMKRFVDHALGGSPRGILTQLALGYIGLTVCRGLCATLTGYLNAEIGWRACNQLRGELTAHALALPYGYHLAHPPGKVLERVDGDINALTNFFSTFLFKLLSSLLLLVGVMAILFTVDTRVGLALTCFCVVSLLILNQIRSVALPSWERAREAQSVTYGLLGEILSTREDWKPLGAVEFVRRTFHERLQALLRVERKAYVLGRSMLPATVVLFGIAQAMNLSFGAWLVSSDTITVGTVVLMYQYTEMLRRPLEHIAEQITDLQKASAAILRVEAFHALPSEEHAVTPVELPRTPLSVELSGVTFAYGNAPVLQGVSFRLEPGKSLGLVGRTGSGKTTLAKLLCLLHRPDGGGLRLGDVDISNASPASVRSRVMLVTQDVQVFQGTVRDNVTLFDRTIGDEAVLAAIQEVGLWRWYSSLPQGLETWLSGGSGMSAGEAQLLAFVRAFLHDPGLVIIDEVSSRLDPATERDLDRAASKLRTGRTSIVIAHHLQTLSRMDFILVLDEGRVLEFGPREELLANPSSHFQRLHQGAPWELAS